MSVKRGEKELAAFAQVMRQKLDANEHKGTHKTADAWWLLDQLRKEVDELEDAVVRWENGELPAVEVAKEAGDVGNFAWFVADVTGALDNLEEAK